VVFVLGICLIDSSALPIYSDKMSNNNNLQ
jgi:hypothetical protein